MEQTQKTNTEEALTVEEMQELEALLDALAAPMYTWRMARAMCEYRELWDDKSTPMARSALTRRRNALKRIHKEIAQVFTWSAQTGRSNHGTKGNSKT